jgi:hypothetical protein
MSRVARQSGSCPSNGQCPLCTVHCALNQYSPCAEPQVSTRAQCSSPGSRQHSITSLHVVSGVTGTSVTRGSPSPPLSPYTLTIICKENTAHVSLQHGQVRWWFCCWDDGVTSGGSARNVGITTPDRYQRMYRIRSGQNHQLHGAQSFFRS